MHTQSTKKKLISKLKNKFTVAKEFRNKREEIKSESRGNVRIDTTYFQLRLRLYKKLWTKDDLQALSFEQFIAHLILTSK